MAWHQPFDLYYWFVNVFAGSMTMFLAISFLIIAMMAAMFRMSVLVIGIVFTLFMILLAAVTGEMYILVIMVAGLIIGWSVSRIIR